MLNDNANQSGVSLHYVCYADVLGFSDLIRKHSKRQNGLNSLLNDIKPTLDDAKKVLDTYSSSYGYMHYRVKMFTDNIILGYPAIDPNERHPASEVLDLFCDYQMKLAADGYFLRGGIAYGDHYQDDNILFGTALLDAIEADKRGAPPRLTILKSALNNIIRHIEYEPTPRQSIQYEQIVQEESGKVFLNYLSAAFQYYPEYPVIFNHIGSHKDNIEKELASNINCAKVKEKFEWVARYHNYACRNFMRSKPVPCDPDADEATVAACEEAQKLADYLIDIEPIPGEFSPINLDDCHISD